MITSWLGLIIAFAGIVLGQTLEGGSMLQLMQPTAALIVFGGTLGATMLSSNLKEFSEAIRAVKFVFLSSPVDFRPLIKELTSLAVVARREGILALERSVEGIKNPFFSSNLRHIVDGYDPLVLQGMMEERMDKVDEEKLGVAKVWETAGGYSPTVGIIGAVLGLIHVMSNLSDSSKLGAGIAVAFVATIYGVGMANLFLLPVATKLKKVAKHQVLEMELIYTGLLGIQAGLNPRVVEERLLNLIGEEASPEGGKVGAEAKAA